MKYFVILLVLVGVTLSYYNLSDAEARTIAPLYITLEDETVKHNSFITADSGMPDITIQRNETISFPFKVGSRVSEPLPVNFFHSMEYALPDTRKTTLPNMKIEFDPFHMVLKPDESQILNVTITTLNYTQLGEHRVTVTAQYPQGEPLLNTGFDVLVVNETQYENPNSNSKYPVPGGGIISDIYPVKQQYEMGINFENLKCNEVHTLIQKYDGSPACVTTETKLKLEQREWTVTVFTSEDFAKHSTLHDGKKNVSKMHVLYSVKKPLGSFETNSFHSIHYENWDYDFLWKASRYGATYLTDDEKDHYQNVLKPNGTNFAMTNHKGPSYYEMTLVEEYLPVDSDLIKFAEYSSDIIEKYGDDMLSHNLGSTGFDEESEDLWIDAMQKPYEWTEVTERGGAFAYQRIGPGFPYFQMADGTWVQLYYLGPRMDNHGLFELYVQGYGSDHPLEEFPEQGDHLSGSRFLVRDTEGSVSLTISMSDWDEYEQFKMNENSNDYQPPIKVTDENIHFVYFDMLLELHTLEGFEAKNENNQDEYRKYIDKDYPIHSHRDIYSWLRLESGKQYGYSVGGDFSPFFEYRDRLYRISSAIID